MVTNALKAAGLECSFHLGSIGWLFSRSLRDDFERSDGARERREMLGKYQIYVNVRGVFRCRFLACG